MQKRASVEYKHPKERLHDKTSTSTAPHDRSAPSHKDTTNGYSDNRLAVDCFLSVFSQIYSRGRHYGPFERVQHLQKIEEDPLHL